MLQLLLKTITILLNLMLLILQVTVIVTVLFIIQLALQLQYNKLLYRFVVVGQIVEIVLLLKDLENHLIRLLI